MATDGAKRAATRHAPSALLAGIHALGSREAATLAFIAALVFLLALYRQLVGLAISPEPVTAADFAGFLWGDFKQHLFAAVAMLVVIQPVRRLGPQDGVSRVGVLVVAVLLAAVCATATRMAWLVWTDGQPRENIWQAAPSIFTRFTVVAGLLVAVGEFHRAEVRGLEAMRTADVDRAALEQQTLQARLRTLEAQIEPHFLFNTLATVRRLYETDAEAGEAMLGRLMRYLEMALPSMRDTASTLEREAQLIQAYLDLQGVRMGRRLAYSVDIAPALRPIEVPPMMLLTLVENAVKHGLAPQRGGGRVDVGAHVDGSQLFLEVVDTGRGFGGGTSGGGTGLANIRARLAAMFGSAAEFTLDSREPHGLRATIRMPLAEAAR